MLYQSTVARRHHLTALRVLIRPVIRFAKGCQQIGVNLMFSIRFYVKLAFICFNDARRYIDRRARFHSLSQNPQIVSHHMARCCQSGF